MGLEGEREGDVGPILWWLMAEMLRLGDGFIVPQRGSSWRLSDFAYRSFMVELLVQLHICYVYICGILGQRKKHDMYAMWVWQSIGVRNFNWKRTLEL